MADHSQGEHELPLRAVHQTGDREVIDLSGTMQRLAGDKELFRDFISYFKEDAPQLLVELRDVASHGDAPAAQRAAHSLKGLAANFGADDCVAAASELEEAAKSGDLNTAEPLLKALEKEVARLQEALREHCA